MDKRDTNNHKLLLNGVIYEHFTLVVPLSNRQPRIMISGLRPVGTICIPQAPELASVTIFADEDKTTVLSEWRFRKEDLIMTEDTAIIKDALRAQ